MIPNVSVELECCPVCGSDLMLEEENKQLKKALRKIIRRIKKGGVVVAVTMGDIEDIAKEALKNGY